MTALKIARPTKGSSVARCFGTVVGAFAIGFTLAGCITINSPAAKPSEAVAPAAIDYSGAQNELYLTVVAIDLFIKEPNMKHCARATRVAEEMSGATPDPAWQGKYETLIRDMKSISALCAGNPLSAEAANLAGFIRTDAGNILTKTKYMGLNWD